MYGKKDFSFSWRIMAMKGDDFMDICKTIKEVYEFLKKVGNVELSSKLLELGDKYYELQQERDRLYEENKKLKEELKRKNEGPLEPIQIIDVYDFGNDF